MDCLHEGCCNTHLDRGVWQYGQFQDLIWGLRLRSSSKVWEQLPSRNELGNRE